MKFNFLKWVFLALFLGVCSFSNAQLSLPALDEEIVFEPIIFTPSVFFNTPSISDQKYPSVGSLPQVYSVSTLPVFCRVEVEIEKAVSFPVKFRLGSVEHVDWLEGKGHDTYLDKQ